MVILQYTDATTLLYLYLFYFIAYSLLCQHFEHGDSKAPKQPLSVSTLLPQLLAKVLDRTGNMNMKWFTSLSYFCPHHSHPSLISPKCIKKGEILFLLMPSPYWIFDYYAFSNILVICNSSTVYIHRTHGGHSYSVLITMLYWMLYRSFSERYNVLRIWDKYNLKSHSGSSSSWPESCSLTIYSVDGQFVLSKLCRCWRGPQQCSGVLLTVSVSPQSECWACMRCCSIF